MTHSVYYTDGRTSRRIAKDLTKAQASESAALLRNEHNDPGYFYTADPEPLKTKKRKPQERSHSYRISKPN
jgi:hypothetical protein